MTRPDFTTLPTCALHPPITAVREAVARALAEDLTPIGDITSALLPVTEQVNAQFVARQDGVIAGRLCADETFAQVDASIALAWHVDDGDRVAPGTVLADVHGSLAQILTAERTALNFLGHLSGIATAARAMVDLLAQAGETKLRVWDTRKTTPGLRSLEKAAVRAGGAANHRGNLSEWVMLKDNHLAVLGIDDAVARARMMWPGRLVQVECDRQDQLVAALDAGADAVLLDNMSPEQVTACTELIASRVAAQRGRPVLVELSGGITAETLAAYVGCGADRVSIGALTNSARVLDIGLDIAVSQP